MTSLLPLDFNFTAVLNEHSFIFILGIIVLFLAVVLRAFKTFLIQSVLLLSLFAVEEILSSPIYILLLVVQAVFAVWVFWKVKEAADITYFRQSEKTLKRSRDLTKGGSAGIYPILY